MVSICWKIFLIGVPHEKSVQGCFISRPGAKGLPSLHLILWLLRDVCLVDKGSLLQSVRQLWGLFKHLQQRSTSYIGKGWESWCT